MDRAVNEGSRADGRREREAAAHVAFPPPLRHGVDSEHEGFETGGRGAIDHLLDQIAVPPRVHLEPEPTRADGADLFDGAGAERRQGVRQPGTRRGPGDGEFACGVGDAGEPGRGEDKWIADRSTEQGRGDVDVLDAAEDPRAERGGGECGFVGGQRALVFRTTVDVVEHAGRQATLRDAAKIGDGSGSRQPSLHAVRLDAFESDHRTQGVEGPHDVSYLRSPPGPASRSRLPSSDARRS